MKIIRVQNPIGIEYMKEHFVDTDRDSDALCNGLKAQLSAKPENILILHVWEGDALVGFIIAQNQLSTPYVFLYQAWVDSKSDPDIADKLFFRLLLWVDLLGKKEIRLETTRNTEAMTRKWKFKKVSAIMSFSIPDNFESGYTKFMQRANDIPNSGMSLENSKEISNGPE